MSYALRRSPIHNLLADCDRETKLPRSHLGRRGNASALHITALGGRFKVAHYGFTLFSATPLARDEQGWAQKRFNETEFCQR
jgi:hypothetical protein